MKRIMKLLTVICIFFALTGCNDKDKDIEWAQNLSVDDIEKIEAVAMPSVEEKRYKEYDTSEFVNITEIINGAKGQKIDAPESISGGGITFYITTTNGERHTFSNNGNVYLVIDGVSYKADYKWLSSWGDIQLNSKTPDDFIY